MIEMAADRDLIQEATPMTAKTHEGILVRDEILRFAFLRTSPLACG